MRAIILAAGRGSRMEALTDEHPKCLVEFRGRTLLSRQLEALSVAGVREVAIVTGYRSEMLQGYAGRTFHNARWANTNMVASLATAAAWLQSGPCIVSYSDIFYEPQAVEMLMQADGPLALTYDPNWLKLWEDRFGDPLLDAETFRLSETGDLIEIGRTPQTTFEIEGQYMGLLRFKPESWAAMVEMLSDLTPDQRDKIDMTSALQRLIKRGSTSITALRYDGQWGEVDRAVDLALYQNGDD